MSIQTKLLILFVAVTSIPLTIGGHFLYKNSKDLIKKETRDRLVTIANIQTNRINVAIERYFDILGYYTNDSSLVEVLSEYNISKNKELLLEIQNDLVEERKTNININVLSIRDLNGLVISSSDPTLIGKSDEYQVKASQLKIRELVNLDKDINNSLFVRLMSPMYFEGKKIGVMEVLMTADYLVSITEDYSSMGETGETTLAKRNETGDIMFITPLRFDAGAALTRFLPSNSKKIAMNLAFSENENEYLDGDVIDYRNHKVFAVTRKIASTDWGLVVKIDGDEALKPVNELLGIFVITMLSLVFLGIVISIIFTKTITWPIKRLIAFAERLNEGDFSTKINMDESDEIGKLGKALNQMVEIVNESQKDMEDKINKRTKELEDQNQELESIMKVIVNREIKMIELKKEIKTLKNKKLVKRKSS